MGGNSSNGNTSSGGLSSLFMGNQPTQTGQQSTVPPIAAPQSYLPQGIPAMPTPHPINYIPVSRPASGVQPAKDDPFGQYWVGGGYGGR